jgi:hypothetical protein
MCEDKGVDLQHSAQLKFSKKKKKKKKKKGVFSLQGGEERCVVMHCMIIITNVREREKERERERERERETKRVCVL